MTADLWLDAPDLRIARLPEAPAFSLRGAPKAAGRVLGVTPPEAILDAAFDGPRAAFKLGPDEWRLEAEEGFDPVPLIAVSDENCAVIDVTGREIALEIAGAGAVTLLASGCPLDLENWPSPRASRTVLGPLEIILIKRDPQRYGLRVLRSYTAYLRGWIDACAREMAAGL